MEDEREEDILVTPATLPMIRPVPAPEKPKPPMADLFEVPKSTDNDMAIDDLFEVPQEDDDDMRIDDLVEVNIRRDVMGGDMSEVTSVSREDIINGGSRKPKLKIRPIKRYQPPSHSGFSGLR